MREGLATKRNSTMRGEWPTGPASSISLAEEYGQELDGQPPDKRPQQLTPPSFGRDVKLGVSCLDAACIGGLKVDSHLSRFLATQLPRTICGKCFLFNVISHAFF